MKLWSKIKTENY